MLLLSLSSTHPNLNPSRKGIASNHLYVLNFLNHAVGNTVASGEKPNKRKFAGNVSVRDCNSVLLTGDSVCLRAVNLRRCMLIVGWCYLSCGLHEHAVVDDRDCNVM